MQGAIVSTNRGLVDEHWDRWHHPARTESDSGASETKTLLAVSQQWDSSPSGWEWTIDRSCRKDFWGESTQLGETHTCQEERVAFCEEADKFLSRKRGLKGASAEELVRPELAAHRASLSANVFIWRWVQYLNENCTWWGFLSICKIRNKLYRWLLPRAM